MVKKNGKEIGIFVISCNDFIQLFIKWFLFWYLVLLGWKMLFFLLIEEDVCILMLLEFEFSIFFLSSETFFLYSTEFSLFNGFVIELVPFFLLVDEGIVVTTLRSTRMNDNPS